jgi:hypothetical protein
MNGMIILRVRQIIISLLMCSNNFSYFYVRVREEKKEKKNKTIQKE